MGTSKDLIEDGVQDDADKAKKSQDEAAGSGAKSPQQAEQQQSQAQGDAAQSAQDEAISASQSAPDAQ